jgi:hypothetical protein
MCSRSSVAAQQGHENARRSEGDSIRLFLCEGSVGKFHRTLPDNTSRRERGVTRLKNGKLTKCTLQS